jgi:hypothetical protein
VNLYLQQMMRMLFFLGIKSALSSLKVCYNHHRAVNLLVKLFKNMSGIPSSSIARKIIMALSGLFLVVFLGQHFVINITSVIAPDTFNTWSHFMGYNPLGTIRSYNLCLLVG